MPLIKSRSKSAKKKNIAELIKSKPGASRAKAIRTYAKRHGVDYATAKRKLAIAVAFNVK